MNAGPGAVGRTHVGAVAVLGTYAVVLLVVPSRYTLGSFAITPAMLVGMAAAGLWLAGLLLPDAATSRGPEPARRGVLIFFALMVLSYLVAVVQPLTASVSRGADRRLAALLSLTGVALLAVDGLRTRQALYRSLGVLVGAGAALATIGIVQFVFDYDLAPHLKPPGFAVDGTSSFVFSRAGSDRVAGTAQHPIEFGIVCAMLLPIALHLAAHAAGAAARRASLVAAGLIALAVPMALSRSAVLAVAVALLILVPSWPAPRRWKMLGGAVSLVWFASLVAPGLLSTVNDLFFGDAAEASNAARARSTDASIDLFADAPWLGQGYGTFQQFVVDNLYLTTLVESGVLGAIALIVLFNGAVTASRRARRTTDEPALRDLGLTMIAIIAGFVVASFGLTTLLYPATSGLVFLCIGIAGAAHRLSRGSALGLASPMRDTAVAVSGP